MSHGFLILLQLLCLSLPHYSFAGPKEYQVEPIFSEEGILLNPEAFPPGFFEPEKPNTPKHRPETSRRASHSREPPPQRYYEQPRRMSEPVAPHQNRPRRMSHSPTPHRPPRDQRRQSQNANRQGETNWDLARDATSYTATASLKAGRLAGRGVAWAVAGAASPELRRFVSNTAGLAKTAAVKIGGEVVPKVIQGTAHVVGDLILPTAGVVARHAWPIGKAAYSSVKPHIVPTAKSIYEGGIKPTWDVSTEFVAKPFYNHVALPTMKKLAQRMLTLGKWESGGGEEPGNRNGNQSREPAGPRKVPGKSPTGKWESGVGEEHGNRKESREPTGTRKGPEKSPKNVQRSWSAGEASTSSGNGNIRGNRTNVGPGPSGLKTQDLAEEQDHDYAFGGYESAGSDQGPRSTNEIRHRSGRGTETEYDGGLWNGTAAYDDTDYNYGYDFGNGEEEKKSIGDRKKTLR